MIRAFAAIIAIAQFFSAQGQVADATQVTVRDEASISGVDEHTIALWLFDEAPYNNATLTDAGPFQLDLRLNTGAKVPASVREGRRGLLPGRFGGALYLPMGDNTGVSWAEGTWISKVGTSRLLDRRNEVPEICNLGYLDYTIEFWFKTDGDQNEPGVVWEVRNEGNGKEEAKRANICYNSLLLASGSERFLLRGEMTRQNGKRKVNWYPPLEIPTDPALLKDGQWHHVAFTYNAAEHQIRHYLDGLLQPMPKIGGFLPLTGMLASMTLGRNGEGKQELMGALDEFRISDVVRYTQDFERPGSFSHNFGSKLWTTAKADGPPLLFGPKAPTGPVALGSRKHLFIDNALVAQMNENVRFTLNPPIRMEATNFRNTHPWEPSPRFGGAVSYISSFWDDGDKINMFYS